MVALDHLEWRDGHSHQHRDRHPPQDDQGENRRITEASRGLALLVCIHVFIAHAAFSRQEGEGIYLIRRLLQP